MHYDRVKALFPASDVDPKRSGVKLAASIVIKDGATPPPSLQKRNIGLNRPTAVPKTKVHKITIIEHNHA